MRSADTLFARLFGVSLVAIVLAHGLAFLWFQQYGAPPPPPPPGYPMGEQRLDDPGLGEAFEGTPPTAGPKHFPGPPERSFFGGPVVPFLFQLVTLVAAAWYGAKLLSRPIRRFSEAAERLSENLDSAPMEEDLGPREARQAAQTFNRMQRRIREQVQQRARMLGAVSHDLRTPLSRLKLRLEQVSEEKLQNQMRQDLDDMIGMLDATLTYLHEQRTSEALQWYDVQALVESLCENAQENGSPAQAQGQCAPLYTQPMALRSCVTNLLDNALRYAGPTTVSLEDSTGELVIRVIDHGPGISADKLETVFEPFYRLEGSRNRNSGGVGLGMTIAREAALRLGGSLALEKTPGGGLTATARIPRLPKV
ncbi:sensor histidine kinase [Pseudomonas typographi]|uniref:histidine kinase n=1 Tax=Pseudomonas typographi TaxID=2715964 RepID=A0ABR7Z3J9_9PSED|nr:HAMP domain-containing sensor histidine kinase [Pseudomonas typographi]MBD1552000.1 HAMP domain-containing histidine kinase [Pseudomonas typographi]MBD1586563.1 HAMP domain-containing histidine kinase [Pseudomonas typographi]MBD1600065.1 HAMP domain-containing histidine kinase [Pseudomonas typographi]